VTLDTDISPDGTQNASRIEMDCTSTSSSDYSAIYQQLALDGGSEYTISFYVKSNTSYNQDLLFFSNSSFSTQITATSEWQRVESTFTSNSTNPRNFGLLAKGNVQQDVDILIWGAQLEELSYATSYIPTNGGQVTRDGETCRDAGEAADFNSEEGVLYAEIAALANDGTYRIFGISDGTQSNEVNLYYRVDDNIITAKLRAGGSSVIFENFNITATNFSKVAFRYKSGESNVFIDGVKQKASDYTTTSMPVGLNLLQFREGNSSSGFFYGKCKAIRVYKEALSDTDLENLTS